MPITADFVIWISIYVVSIILYIYTEIIKGRRLRSLPRLKWEELIIVKPEYRSQQILYIFPVIFFGFLMLLLAFIISHFTKLGVPLQMAGIIWIPTAILGGWPFVEWQTGVFRVSHRWFSTRYVAASDQRSLQTSRVQISLAVAIQVAFLLYAFVIRPAILRFLQ